MAAEQKEEKYNALAIGDEAPDFTTDSSAGQIHWHEYIKGSWAILFSHPRDFTPVCTTEIGRVAHLSAEFKKRGVRLATISVDTAENHHNWIKDINEITKSDVDFPILADPDRKLSVLYGMLSKDHLSEAGLPFTVRAVFVIAPDRKIKAVIGYPASTGRNLSSLLKLVDSLQLANSHPVSTPAGWVKGLPVVLNSSVSDEDAKKYSNLKALVPYVRSIDDLAAADYKETKVSAAAAAARKAQGSLRIADVIPDFSAKSTQGDLKFHEHINGSWSVLFTYPHANDVVTTTELSSLAQVSGEFAKRSVKLVGVATDNLDKHEAWLKDVNSLAQGDLNIPLIGDADRKITSLLGALNQESTDSEGAPHATRAVYIIGADKKIKLSYHYPAGTGRDWDEVLRTIDSLKLTAYSLVATPVDWKDGQRCLVLPTVPTEEASKKFKNLEVVRPWFRLVDQPEAGAAPAAAAPAPAPVPAAAPAP